MGLAMFFDLPEVEVSFDHEWEPEAPIDVGGKIVFMVDSGSVPFLVMEDGQKFGTGLDYDRVDGPLDIGGKISFRAYKDGKWLIATEDGREIGKDIECEDMAGPADVGGKIAFTIRKDFKWHIVTEDGQEIRMQKVRVFPFCKRSRAFDSNRK